MNYNDLLTQVALTIVVDNTDTNYNTAFPNFVLLAESRAYRDLNLLDAMVIDGSASCSPNNRNFNLPTTVGTFIVVQDINIITPANTAPDVGTRVRLTPVSLAVIDATYPSVTGAGPPQQWAPISQNTYLTGAAAQKMIAFGPWPDQTYRVEVIGQIQPAPISPSNLSSWLTDNLWDVMFSATVCEAVAWQQNFSQGPDNPQMANTWNARYQAALTSATTIAARARLGGPSWTGTTIEPVAQPQRG